MTLDDAIAAKLKAEARRSGRAFKVTVNEALQRGLATQRSSTPARPFRVRARDLGRLKPGLSLDSVARLLEQVEGPLHR